MADWFSFEGQIVPMEWGDSVYTVLPIPDDVSQALEAQGTKRVETRAKRIKKLLAELNGN